MPGKINAGVIIPAAGLSSRFGGEPKALACFEGRSLLSRAVEAFRLCGLNEIIVVTGHHRPEVEEEADDLGVKAVFNTDYQDGMFSSIQTGLKALESDEAFFILPVDGALVRAGTILSLLSVWRKRASKRKKRPILIPAFGSKAGHPPLISVAFKADILHWSSPGGLRGWLASQMDQGRDDFLHNGLIPRKTGEKIEFIELKDEGIICDIDTKDDLATAELTPDHELPRIPEAWQLLLQNPLSQAKIRHHLKVASSALRLTLALKTAGEKEADPYLSLLSGLLHDLARDHDQHARAGRLRLAAMGWPELALVVGAHTDPPAVFLKGLALGLGLKQGRQDDPAYAEASRRVRLSSLAVYLSDKYWWDDEAVSIRQRFEITRRHKLDGGKHLEILDRAEASQRDLIFLAIKKREAVALGIEYWFRRILAKDPENVARTRSGDDAESDLEILYKDSFGRKKHKTL